ncbi:hypothetical protein KY284_018513 [Solanum tuberosum]|nr:hypothetical protein KY284_018513 [Solanum tuberosum]
MKSGESLQDMITRFTTVVNELISLGKTYTTEEQVDKVLRTLPRSWEIKVTAIREAKDLTNMTLDELEGNLKTYEMNVDKRSEGNKEKKIGLKATESDESDIDDEDLALISRNFKKLFKKGHEFWQNGITHQREDYRETTKWRDCPMWEVEWRKERAKKEKRELSSKRKNKEKEQAMYAAWGIGSDMYKEDADVIALMAIEESEPYSDI